MSERIKVDTTELHQGGFSWVEWVLRVGPRSWYLGQDVKFVERVLGADYDAFVYDVVRMVNDGVRIEDAIPEVIIDTLDLTEDEFIDSLNDVEPWGLAP